MNSRLLHNCIQWHHRYSDVTVRKGYSPEQKLAIAILERAIRDLYSLNKDICRDANKWLRAEVDHVGSFIWCLQFLCLDHSTAYIRKCILSNRQEIQAQLNEEDKRSGKGEAGESVQKKGGGWRKRIRSMAHNKGLFSSEESAVLRQGAGCFRCDVRKL